MGFVEENLRFIGSIRKYILLSAIVLTAGLIAGLFLPEDIKYQFLKLLQDKANAMGQVNGFTLFINNISVSLLLILSGLLVIFPLLIVFYNGLGMGGILSLFGPVMGWPQIMGAIMIHGVFELSAFILAGSLGMIITLQMFKRSPLNLGWPDLLLKIANITFLVITPLLIVAAILESTVSQAYMINANKDLYQKPEVTTLNLKLAEYGFYEKGTSFREYVAINTQVPDLNKPLPRILFFTNQKGESLRLLINESNRQNDLSMQKSAFMSNYIVLSNNDRIYYVKTKLAKRVPEKLIRLFISQN